jgi:hypothetical protein
LEIRHQTQFGPSVFPWVVGPVFGQLLASGRWSGDVVPVLRLDRSRLRLGSGPPKRHELEYLRRLGGNIHLESSLRLPSGASAEPYHQGKQDRRAGQCAYGVRHIVVALGALEHLTASRHLQDSTESMLKYALPHRAQSVLREMADAGVEHPAADTLDRSMVRLDVAVMNAERLKYVEEGPYYRYPTYDSSPKHGLEVFNCLEDYIRQVDVHGLTMEQVDLSKVVTRNLPVMVMSQGCCDTVGKTITFTHQSWLVYGATKGHLYASNDDVRLSLSDMGVERYIVNTPCVVEAFYAGVGADPPHLDEADFMFKNAFECPGSQHAVDWCLHRALEHLDGWLEWLVHAQNLTAFMRVVSYRNAMSRLLRVALNQEAFEAHVAFDVRVAVATLKYFSATLADWRWQTALTVTTQVIKVKVALLILEKLYGENLRSRLGMKKDSKMFVKAREAWNSEAFRYDGVPRDFWLDTKNNM